MPVPGEMAQRYGAQVMEANAMLRLLVRSMFDA